MHVCVTTVVKLRCIKVVIEAMHAMTVCVCVCGAQSEAITGRPDDKIVQSEHGRRMKVGGDGTEEGEIRCEEKRLDGEYSTKHLVVNIFLFFCVLYSSGVESQVQVFLPN